MNIHVPGHLKPSESGWYLCIRAAIFGPIYSADWWEGNYWMNKDSDVLCNPLTFCGPFQDPQLILEAQYKIVRDSLKKTV